jgi:hypothetical protein
VFSLIYQGLKYLVWRCQGKEHFCDNGLSMKLLYETDGHFSIVNFIFFM